MLFDKPGLLLKCALDKNEDDGLKFWFDSCFPSGAINKATDADMEKAITSARKRDVVPQKMENNKGYSLTY